MVVKQNGRFQGLDHRKTDETNAQRKEARKGNQTATLQVGAKMAGGSEKGKVPRKRHHQLQRDVVDE